MVIAVDVPQIFPKTTTWPQWLSGLAAMLMIMVPGMMMGWTSPYLAKLQGPDSPLPITASEGSWVASLVNVGRLIGGILGAICMEFFGSKTAMFAAGLPLALGWISMIFADEVIWLYVSRTLAGLGMGMSFSCFPLYIGEISNANVRGALVTMSMNGGAVGTFLGNLLGAYVSMSDFAIVALVPTGISLILFAVTPESPHHLVRRGRMEAAEKAYAWYHRGTDAAKEVEALRKFESAFSDATFAGRLRELNAPKYRRAALIIVVLFMFMHICGMNSVVYYMEIILTKARVKAITPAHVVVMAGILSIAVGWPAMYLIEKCGRRVLLVTSSLGVGLSLASLAAHFAMLEHVPGAGPRDWLPITSIICFQVFFCVGLLIIPSAMLSELFPSNLKIVAALLCGISSGVFSFAAAKTYQPLEEMFGIDYVLWLYTVCTLCAVPFALFWMPETKGKSLEEIQRGMMPK